MKTGNDLVAEQVRYSTCFCYLPNCANQHNFAALQRIAVLLPDSSIGCIDSFLSIHRIGLYRHKGVEEGAYTDFLRRQPMDNDTQAQDRHTCKCSPTRDSAGVDQEI